MPFSTSSGASSSLDGILLLSIPYSALKAAAADDDDADAAARAAAAGGAAAAASPNVSWTGLSNGSAAAAAEWSPAEAGVGWLMGAALLLFALLSLTTLCTNICRMRAAKPPPLVGADGEEVPSVGAADVVSLVDEHATRRLCHAAREGSLRSSAASGSWARVRARRHRTP